MLNSQPIPLSSPDVSPQDRQLVLDVLSGPTLSLGPMLPAFEKALAAAAGTQYAVAVNSGTSALHLCVKAAGLGAGDEVITSPFSFVASSNCLLFEGAMPRFVDIDPETYNIDPALIPGAVNERTRGVLPIHVFGRPCDMETINHLAARKNWVVIEDSCEAIGASINGKLAGSFGQSACFAFYPNKQITTGEGGALITDDERVARLAKSWRNQGRGDGGSWLQHERLGYNYRLSDVNCALGIGQLSRLDSILQMRESVAREYTARLAEVPEVIVPAPVKEGTVMSWFVYVIRLRDEFSRADRDRILESLRGEGIGCNNYFSPIHLQDFYQKEFGYRRGDFPVTELVADRTIALPFFNHLSPAQMETVVASLKRAIGSLSRGVVSVPELAAAAGR
ncbi:MAG: DegT/DnrJ/EryC1/StrS family aminotransferase [Bryobacteraceae bacterium]|nr:DegT/DnrJ/EryC1/StrS family aminotransferase [Bryobacteraceae bacterium]